MRWTITPRVKLVGGIFDVRQPYFNTDERNVFTVLGNERHRGAEISLTANPTDRLNVIAGAVLMKPRVTGEAVSSGRIGRKPLGQSATILRGNANYRLPFLEGVSLDLATSWFSARAASRDNLDSLKPYLTVDVGARYQFKIGRSPATFRVQMQNVTNTFAWNVLDSNSYGLMDKRRVNAFLAMDF